MLSQFVGGMPPAIFLFLTGVTLAFLMDSTERKGLRPVTAFHGFPALGIPFRAGFRVPAADVAVRRDSAPWTDLLRVDILNAMGFAMAVMSVMALFRTAERVRLCAALGLAIALAAPLVSQIDSSGLPGWCEATSSRDYNAFSFFPWGAYLAFGMSAGSAIRDHSARKPSSAPSSGPRCWPGRPSSPASMWPACRIRSTRNRSTG